MRFSSGQEWNALQSMKVSVEGRVTSSSCSHSQNALSPILATPSGMSIFLIAVPWKKKRQMNGSLCGMRYSARL